MDKDDVIATLNDLIETSRDGEEGFRTCADGVKSSQLKQMSPARGQSMRAGGERIASPGARLRRGS